MQKRPIYPYNDQVVITRAINVSNTAIVKLTHLLFSCTVGRHLGLLDVSGCAMAGPGDRGQPVLAP